MTIVPDTKDWTWVTRERCPECGFDGAALPREAVAETVRRNARAWPAVLTAADVAVRPDPARWSALEYACHVRDVFRLYDERLRLMLTQDGPRFPDWDQDATAVEQRYGEHDPRVVATEVVAAGEALADAFAAVRDDQWSRTGTRSDGAHFTVDSFGRYLAHDPVHHLWDVTGRSAAEQLGGGEPGRGSRSPGARQA